MKFQTQWFERLPSTNTFLKERLALDGRLPAGTVIAAHEQTGGRGRHQRVWLSGSGENLTFSLLLRGPYEMRRLPSVTMAAAVAVADLLADVGLVPALKWPNDVLTGGRKICGILAESVPGGVIVGIGLNVNMEHAGHIDQPATSLLMETGLRRSVAAVLEQLLRHLADRLDAWEQGGFDAVRGVWESSMGSAGRTVSVRDGTQIRQGTVAGLGPDGELLLQEADGVVRPVWAGDLSG